MDQKNDRPVTWDVRIAAIALIVSVVFSIINIVVTKNQTRLQLAAQQQLFENQKETDRQLFDEQKQTDRTLFEEQKAFDRKSLQQQLQETRDQFEKSLKQNQEAIADSRSQYREEMKINQQQYQATLDEISGKAELERRRSQITSYLDNIILNHLQTSCDYYGYALEVLDTLYADMEDPMGKTNVYLSIGNLSKIAFLEYKGTLDKLVFLPYSLIEAPVPPYSQKDSVTRVRNLAELQFRSLIRANQEAFTAYRDRIATSEGSTFLVLQHLRQNYFNGTNPLGDIQYDSSLIDSIPDYELIEIFGHDIETVIALKNLHTSLKKGIFDITYRRWAHENIKEIWLREADIRSWYRSTQFVYDRDLDHVSAYHALRDETERFLSVFEEKG